MLVDRGAMTWAGCAEPGTVKVHNFSRSKRYSHVMHLVSTVTGRLAEGRNAFDVVTACFPAGTLSGAESARDGDHRAAGADPAWAVRRHSSAIWDFAGDADHRDRVRTALVRDGGPTCRRAAGNRRRLRPGREDTESLTRPAPCSPR